MLSDSSFSLRDEFNVDFSSLGSTSSYGCGIGSYQGSEGSTSLSEGLWGS